MSTGGGAFYLINFIIILNSNDFFQYYVVD